MKLYATVSSERATKGQGGNEYIIIDINVLDPVSPLYHVEITKDYLILREKGYSNPIITLYHKDIRQQ